MTCRKRTGDFNYVNRLYDTSRERDALEDAVEGTGLEEDIMSMVNEGHEQAFWRRRDGNDYQYFPTWRQGSWDIMTHRTNMVVLSADTTLREAVDFILKEGTNTRYPVYGEDIDDIVASCTCGMPCVF